MLRSLSVRGLLRGWRERARALKNIPPLLRMVWRAAPGAVAAGLALRLAAALVPIAMLWVGKLIVDLVAASARQGGVIDSRIGWLLFAEFALVCGGNVAGRLIDFCDSILADRFTQYISQTVMRHTAALDLQALEDPGFQDKLDRARVQATDRLAMLRAMGTMLQQAITLVSMAAGVFVFSPWILLLLVVCVVPAFLGESHFAFLGYSLAFSQTPRRRELDYLRLLGASRDSAKEVKLFGLADHLVGRYSELTDGIVRENRRLATKRVWAGSALATLTALGYYGAYAWVVWETASGRLSLGSLPFLAGAISSTSQNLSSLFSTFSSIADQSLFLTDLIEFLAVQPRIVSRPDAIPAPRAIGDGFEFRNVSFHYPGSERRVLRNLDFRMAPGERIALVGENGQGKTTFVKLLARLYDPTEGQILLDGVDLREYRLEDLQRLIGVIFQDFMRYDWSARHNIAVGDLARAGDDAAIREAARKSLASTALDRFPRGLEQMLGRRFEGGMDLSGGEWQKFAIARAYLRDAQVLVMDEPTAALDAIAEYEVFQRFSDLTAGKMALLISHRFSTVRMADRIVVLADGQIREQGTHDQLMSSDGRYAHLFNLQAASYR